MGPLQAAQENQLGAVEDEPEERPVWEHGGPERSGRRLEGLWTPGEGRAVPDSHTLGRPGPQPLWWMARVPPEGALTRAGRRCDVWCPEVWCG